MKIRTVVLLGLLAALVAAAHAQTSSIPLTITDSACAASVAINSSGQQTAAPCTVQLYRAQVAANATSCPTFSTTTYSEVNAALAMTTSPLKTTDSSGLISGFAYCYAGTVTWTSGGTGPSPLSNTFQSVLPLVPAAPTITAGA